MGKRFEDEVQAMTTRSKDCRGLLTWTAKRQAPVPVFRCSRCRHYHPKEAKQ